MKGLLACILEGCKTVVKWPLGLVSGEDLDDIRSSDDIRMMKQLWQKSHVDTGSQRQHQGPGSFEISTLRRTTRGPTRAVNFWKEHPQWLSNYSALSAIQEPRNVVPLQDKDHDEDLASRTWTLGEYIEIVSKPQHLHTWMGLIYTAKGLEDKTDNPYSLVNQFPPHLPMYLLLVLFLQWVLTNTERCGIANSTLLGDIETISYWWFNKRTKKSCMRPWFQSWQC